MSVSDGLKVTIDREILGIKLTNGQDVVSMVTRKWDDTRQGYVYSLDQPFAITIQATSEGMATGLIPFAFFDASSNCTVEIEDQHVMFTYKVANGIEQYYRDQTGRVAVASSIIR